MPRRMRGHDEAGGTRVMVLASLGRHFSAGINLAVFDQAGTLGTANVKEVIDYARDHSVAESFAHLNALQPGVFSSEHIQRAALAQNSGQPAQFADLAPIRPTLG
jgi:enoyl-CoA hydratase/carnithine racemase